MIPARIQVFDGLRVTTEHILHFQESLQSAIEEVRSVLGLGRVHVGFEVTAQGADSVVVGPGIAFDAAGGRIVHEEAEQVTLDAEVLAAGAAVLYARRELIERGHVEGRATLLWDDCSFHLRATPPEAAEGLVPLAHIRSGDSGLVVAAPGAAQAAPGAPPAPTPADTAPVLPAPVVPERIPVQGGIIHLAGQTNGDAGRAPLLQAVRATLAPDGASTAGPNAAPADSIVELAAASLAAPAGAAGAVGVAALTAQLLVCATRRDVTPAAPGGAAQPPLWQRECEAHGHARAEGAAWTQNSLSRTVTFAPAARLAHAALSEDALALLVLPLVVPEDATLATLEEGNPMPLALRVRIQPVDPLRMVVELVWSGRAHEGLLAQADALLESLEWSLDGAWQGC